MILKGLTTLMISGLILTVLVRLRRYRSLQKGAVALITGGGSGLGLELAKLCSEAGCIVVLVGRQRPALEAAAEVCKKAGAPQALVLTADLSTREGVRAVRTGVDAAGLRVKYLILNAGAGAIAPFNTDDHFDDICHDMMNINYYANVWMLQEFLPMLTELHSGRSPSRIIVISSLAGVLPSILRSAYTASKHAIQGFMNALRGETDVPITLCCPGYVDTDFHARVLTSDGNPLPTRQHRGMSAAKCARQCMRGAKFSDAEVIMTLSGKLGYCLRPFLTNLVDLLAKRKSLKSLEA